MKAILLFVLLVSSLYSYAESQTVWVTKYALTKGIQKVQAEVMAQGKLAVTADNYYRTGEFWFTEEEAKAKARKMKQAKIDSSVRNLKKLTGKDYVF